MVMMFFIAHDCSADENYKVEGLLKPDNDGVLQSDEYEVLTENGALTRRPCPHKCEDRGIPRQFCREWVSRKGDECYIWDTRLPQDAVPFDGGSDNTTSVSR